MVRFDTRKVKPKVWDIAILTAVMVVTMLVLLRNDPVDFHAVSFTMCSYLALAIVFLMIGLIKQLQYNPYSYNTIYYTGFMLFTASVLAAQLRIIYIHRFYEVADHESLIRMLISLLTSARTYMMYSAPFILVFSIGLCVSNVVLIRHEGKRLVNLLGILLAFLMIGGELFLYLSSRLMTGTIREVLPIELGVNSFAALYLYYECMLIGAIIANLIVINYKPDYNSDYIIILGCGIREDGTPTPLLAGRIDRALKFAEEQIAATGHAPVFVASGGRGPDESRSESDAIRSYLMERGVPDERIIRENRSTDTHENMQYSKELIFARDPDARILYATTNYHVFRSGLMARRVKMRAIGIGSHTKWYFWPNATVREFVGILTEHRLKQALILGGMLLTYILITVLYHSFL